MEHAKPQTLAPQRLADTLAGVPRISSEQLMAGAKEVLIEHHGTLYRLRQTALGKLILTK
ncbi:MAG: hemin uptake protein HemP [Rhizobacter sp.]